jgi:hypothetical protein
MQNSVVFVVDERYSPLWRVAISHSYDGEIEVLCSNEFATVRSLSNKIVDIKPQCVIFSWRGAFDTVLSSSRARKVIEDEGIHLFLLIPDLMGVVKYDQAEQKRIDLADGVIVTSRELYNKYQSIYQLTSIQILHDLVPIEALEAELNLACMRNRKQLLWIGNSEWGKRQGFIDHKGLRSVAMPVFNLLKEQDPEIYLKVIDSASEKVPYENVLHELAISDCLLFTSKSEGTGLPLIEAASLGTPVVTFNVGIASELLIDHLSNLISPPSIEIFAGKVLEVLSNRDSYSDQISKRAREYRREIASEFENLQLTPVELGTWRTFCGEYRLKLSLLWLLRWMKYHLRSL